MLSRVNRVIPIVVLAAASAWAIAMLGPGRSGPRIAAPEPDEDATLPAPAEPVPRPPSALAGEHESEPSSARFAPEKTVGPEVGVESDIDRRRVDLEPGRRDQDAVEALAPDPQRTDLGEARRPDQGEGYLSPDFVESQTDYAYEPRDGNWARPTEKRIRDLMRAAGLGAQIQVVNCRTNVCRVQVELAEGESLQRVLEIPGLADELGIDDSTPYSLRAGQLSIYGRRAGTR